MFGELSLERWRGRRTKGNTAVPERTRYLSGLESDRGTKLSYTYAPGSRELGILQVLTGLLVIETGFPASDPTAVAVFLEPLYVSGGKEGTRKRVQLVKHRKYQTSGFWVMSNISRHTYHSKGAGFQGSHYRNHCGNLTSNPSHRP